MLLFPGEKPRLKLAHVGGLVLIFHVPMRTKFLSEFCGLTGDVIYFFLSMLWPQEFSHNIFSSYLHKLKPLLVYSLNRMRIIGVKL